MTISKKTNLRFIISIILSFVLIIALIFVLKTDIFINNTKKPQKNDKTPDSTYIIFKKNSGRSHSDLIIESEKRESLVFFAKKELMISVSDKEIEDKITENIKNNINKNYTKDLLIKDLALKGLLYSDYKMLVSDDIILSKVPSETKFYNFSNKSREISKNALTQSLNVTFFDVDESKIKISPPTAAQLESTVVIREQEFYTNVFNYEMNEDVKHKIFNKFDVKNEKGYIVDQFLFKDSTKINEIVDSITKKGFDHTADMVEYSDNYMNLGYLREIELTEDFKLALLKKIGTPSLIESKMGFHIIRATEKINGDISFDLFSNEFSEYIKDEFKTMILQKKIKPSSFNQVKYKKASLAKELKKDVENIKNNDEIIVKTLDGYKVFVVKKRSSEKPIDNPSAVERELAYYKTEKNNAINNMLLDNKIDQSIVSSYKVNINRATDTIPLKVLDFIFSSNHNKTIRFKYNEVDFIFKVNGENKRKLKGSNSNIYSLISGFYLKESNKKVSKELLNKAKNKTTKKPIN